jgi:hypothetical protein
MDRHDTVVTLIDTQSKLLDCVTALSKVERELIKEESFGVESDRLFKLSSKDIEQLEDGFTITVIGNGVAIRLEMKGEI